MPFDADSLRLTFAGAYPRTELAIAFACVVVAVLGREFVAALTVRLAGVRARETASYKSMLSGVYCLEVAGVAARLAVAKVVDLVARRHRTVFQFVGETVRSGVVFAGYVKNSIALRICARKPRPAIVPASLLYVVAEAIPSGHVEQSERPFFHDVAIQPKTLVVARAQAPRPCRPSASFGAAFGARLARRFASASRISVAPSSRLVWWTKPAASCRVEALHNLADTPTARRQHPTMMRITVLSYPVVVSCAYLARNYRAVASVYIARSFHTSIIARKFSNAV